MRRIAILSLILVLATAGCSAPAANNAPSATPETATAFTSAVAATETPVQDLAQTPTPEPSKEPATAKSILHAFVDAKLPVGKSIEYTEETDENKLLGRPNQYTQKVNWGDDRVDGSDENYTVGTIEVFLTPEDAKARQEYVESVTKDMPTIQTYNYTNGVYHMRLSYDLTPKQAKEYEDIFISLTK